MKILLPKTAAEKNALCSDASCGFSEFIPDAAVYLLVFGVVTIFLSRPQCLAEKNTNLQCNSLSCMSYTQDWKVLKGP